MALLGCPFCRDLYSDDEAERCPVCGVDLKPIADLPPSWEAREEEAAAWEAIPAVDRTLPVMFAGRGRGLLLVIAVLGLATFFAPWIIMTKPDDLVISGYQLARARAGWFWGGAVAWFILIPLVATRRTVFRMRGVRIIAAMFASMTLIEIVTLVANPPQGHRYLPLEYGWGWGLYASALVSAAGVAVAARFGGGLDNFRDLRGAISRRKRTPSTTTRSDTVH
jgi:hypothetical protein